MAYTALHPVRRFSMIGFVIAMFITCNPTIQYGRTESIGVGNLSGSITFAGKLPQTRKFNLATYPDPYFCGRVSDGKGWRIGPRASVNSDSRFSGAVVYIKDLKANKPPENRTNTIRSLNCRFTPFISLLQKGDDLTFENWDPVLHQIEVFQTTSQGGRLLLLQNINPHHDSTKSEFLESGRKGVHRSGPPLTHEVKDEGVLFIRCPFHEYMETWGLVLSHQYYAISDEEGKFSISGIPTGTHTLVVWHPIGRTEQTITIRDQETISVNVQFTPSRSSFYREPEVKTNPFGIELLGDSHIVPSVELQTE